jgi:hypothetical protein
MITLDEIRNEALSLPGTTEGLHFRLPTFKVGDKGFVTVQKNAAIIAVPQVLAEALAESEPDKYETVWRNASFFVGIKVNLSSVDISEVTPLLKMAFENQRK